MSYRSEPPFTHGGAARIGVLLVNLGTPDAPTPAALRRYLAEFLSDPRVVEIPKLLWWLILHGVILRVRPAKSARKYAAIWMPEGSPLAVWTTRQATLLRGYLGQTGHSALVRHAMRYGQPSIAAELDALRAEGATRVLVLPLYPQYSAATSASVFDAVAAWGQRSRWVPELRFVQQYHDDPGYIAALATQVRAHWQREGRGAMLVMSFHGMPERTLHLGDPYHCSCHKTARLLAAELGLPPEQYRVTFQSRFGQAKWLQPYTEATLQQLARDGIERVDIVCPGFVADCLETLEEIDQEAREAFIAAGGNTSPV
jgi:protoporphyrin/coproporphyrin ferrochelatase